eukprot:scaffold36304_cov121-Isochrysis_galbana.AAC.6
MPSLGCWCLAPESTLRHLWTSQSVRRRSVLGIGFTGVEFTVVCGRVLSSVVQGRVCGVRAAAVLAHTVSLGVGMLRGLLERAKLLFTIVDLMSVNGAAFRQLRVACETHTGVLRHILNSLGIHVMQTDSTQMRHVCGTRVPSQSMT